MAVCKKSTKPGDNKPKPKHPWRIWTEGGFSSDKHVKDKIIPLAARMGVAT